MGTRNLTIVKANDEIKVAQYCQWDGYPSGQGATILNFLKNADLEHFKHVVSLLGQYSDRGIENLWKEMGADGSGFVSLDISDKFKEKYPHLHRDCGADILQMIYDKDIFKVRLDEDFLNDSLFCEWAYTIDLDENVLKVHNGGHHVIKEYPLDKLKLPTLKKFVNELESIAYK